MVHKKKPHFWRSFTKVLSGSFWLVKRFSAAFGAFLVVLSVFAAVIWGAYYAERWLRSLIEERLFERLTEIELTVNHEPIGVRIEPRVPVRVPPAASPAEPPVAEEEIEPAPAVPVEHLVSASFTDLFSGIGWLNTTESTLYHDREVMAFYFPAKFSWEKSEPREIPARPANCIGGRCLSVVNNSLFLDGALVNLPSDVRGQISSVSSVSVGVLENVWLVGVVIQRNSGYEGWVYEFDGASFTDVFTAANTPFVSEHTGIFGFGGERNSWLAVFGSYRGIAVQVLSDVSGQMSDVINISDFFPIRVMAGGFEPAIIRSGVSGQMSDVSYDWYVWSLTGNVPKFIKLFENGTGRVQGAIDFTSQLDLGKYRSALFSPVPGFSRRLAAKLDNEFWEFRDDGFDKSSAREAVSSSINTYPAAVRTASVSEIRFAGGGGTVEFQLSNDGKDWFTVKPGEEIVFPDKNGRLLLWRARATPDREAYNSPFLSRIILVYRLKFF